MTPAKVGAVLILVLTLQLELFADLPVFGVIPDLLLGVSVLVGIQSGAERGAAVGFAAGLLYDLFLPTPITLSAVSYALVAFAVGRMAENFADNAVARGIALVLAMIGVASGFMVFVLIGELLGQENLWTDRLNRIVLIGTPYTVFVTVAFRRLTRWALSNPYVSMARPMRVRGVLS